LRALEYFTVPSDRVRVLAVACGFFNAGAPQFFEVVLSNPDKLRDLARKSKAAAISTHDAATALGQRRNQRNQRFSGTIILGIHYLRRFLLRKILPTLSPDRERASVFAVLARCRAECAIRAGLQNSCSDIAGDETIVATVPLPTFSQV
jgi:hypothetical protein